MTLFSMVLLVQNFVLYYCLLRMIHFLYLMINCIKKTEGIALGSPLGPLFANIFLTHFEDLWMKDSPVKPLMYNRYVDDTFWLLHCDEDVDLLLSFLNSRHPN